MNYLFHGPLGLQTRDLTWKPEYRQAVTTAIDTLKLLKKADRGLNVEQFVDDRYIRAAFKASGADYDAALKNYAQQPLLGNDVLTDKPISDTRKVAQIWVRGEPKVRSYATASEALGQLAELKQQGKDIRAVYAQASDSGIKLLASQAWFVRGKDGALDAFLLREQADAFARQHGGEVADFAAASQQAVASR